MAKDGTVTVKITGDSKGLKDALDDSDSHLSKFGGNMGGIAKGVGQGFATIGTAAFVFGAAAVKAFAEAEQVAAQTGAVIKSTGGVAKVSAGDVGTLADSLSKMSGVDDEAIASGENLLLTFTKVRNETGKGNDVFNQATQAALDMSVAMGTDMSSASMLVGKALNDPIKGMTALTKSGIQFTDKQKSAIKALVESGDQMGAQKIILKELETQFGGSAKAAGDTFAGQLNKLKVAAGNFMEDVGSKLVPILMKVGEWLGENIPKAIDVLRPIFDGLVGGVRDFVVAFTQGTGPVDGFAGKIVDIGIKAREFWEAIKVAIGWVQDFVAKFRGGQGEVGESAGKLGKIVTQIKENFESAFGAIKAVVEVAVAIISDIWDRFGSTLLEFIKGTWNGILEVIRAAFEIISGIFDLVKAVFTGKWGDAWDAIMKILDGAWDLIVGVIRNVLTNVIPTLFETAKVLLSAAFGLIWNALKTVLDDAWDLIVGGISTAIDGVVGFFRDLPGRLISAVGDLFGFVRTKMDDANAWVSGKIEDLIGFFAGLPGRIASSAGDLFGFVRTKIDDAKNWVSERLGDIVGFFTGMPGRISGAVSGMFDGIKGAFKGALNGVIGMWNDLRIPSFSFGGWDTPFGKTPSFNTPAINFPDITPLAAGGPISGLALVGEKGPELFAGHGTIIPNDALGGTTVNNYLTIEVSALTSLGVSEAVIEAIKEYERRNGQGWRAA